MKNKILIIIFMIFSFGVYANDITVIDMLNGENFKETNLKSIEKPTKYELSVINFILKNTNEINIHQMRGEKDNKIYLSKDGHNEMVINKKKKEIIKNYNTGTYNRYSNFENPINHFIYDTLLWLKYGVIQDNVTDIKERLYYYFLDLELGIQAYIFSDIEKIYDIDFDNLSEEEQNTYKFFKYLIFNEKYNYKLNSKTKKTYKKSGEEYVKYLQQVYNLIFE